jgi:branched-chain amino acid transport system ATP-binding protein
VELELSNVHARVAGKPVLQGLSLSLARNEIVCLIGAPGCGKSTVLRSVFGQLRVDAGSILYKGVDITNRSARENIASGIVYVPQGGRVFRSLSVAENLSLAAFPCARDKAADRMSAVYAFFPKLLERRGQLAGSLSGGERQMLALGMGLVPEPQLILLDEPSTGLSPIMTEKMLTEVKRLSQALGATVLLVEQNVRNAVMVSNRVLIMRRGTIAHEQPLATLDDVQSLLESYAFISSPPST